MPPRDLATTTADILGRMLRRLPPSLWDNSPASNTPQRDVYRAIAAQCAIWLEQRGIARTMTLLLEAEGADLDVLLQDYGLRRYLQRPDPYARQIGMHILWTPKATQYAIANLADLLFDVPHVTLRTGRNHLHVFLADTHPVTTPYSYWGLVSEEGVWYAVGVDVDVPTISQAPPPGLNVAPGPHTLHWFVAQDAANADWYVSIHGDTLTVSQTSPSGYGTREPLRVLDGQGNLWGFGIDSGSEALITVLDAGLAGFGYWSLTDAAGTTYRLWIEADVPTIATTAPGGATDQTPGGSAVRWIAVEDDTGAVWYVDIEDDTLVAERTAPGGSGSTALCELLDVTGQLWVLTVQRGTEALVATPTRSTNADLVVLTPAHPYEAFQLVDSAGVPWWWSIDGEAPFLSVSLPMGAQDVTPAGGPFAWLRVTDLAGTLWYAFPSTIGVLVLESAPPTGTGTALPQALGDAQDVLWHFGVDPSGNFGISDAPNVLYESGVATAVCVNDPTGARWFLRVDGQVLEWSAVLWPDTVDQSPWGELGWLQVSTETGEPRFVAPSPLGDPIATLGAPAPWGWQAPLTLRDTLGRPWHLTIRTDGDADIIGVVEELPDDLPILQGALPLQEALEAFAHIQPAGGQVTVLVR